MSLRPRVLMAECLIRTYYGVLRRELGVLGISPPDVGVRTGIYGFPLGPVPNARLPVVIAFLTAIGNMPKVSPSKVAGLGTSVAKFIFIYFVGYKKVMSEGVRCRKN